MGLEPDEGVTGGDGCDTATGVTGWVRRGLLLALTAIRLSNAVVCLPDTVRNVLAIAGRVFLSLALL